MAMKRVCKDVHKTLKTILQTNKKCFSTSIIFRSDGHGDSGSAPGSDTGLSSSSYGSGASQNYSKLSSNGNLLTPAFKQDIVIDPPAFGTETFHQTIGNAQQSYFGNTASSEPSADAHREVSPAEKGNVHILRTNLNQESGNQDDVSLLASRRVDPSTVKQVYYFDTLAFVKKLESRGFAREQAEGVAECLVEIINTTLDHQGKHMISKSQQEIAVQQLLSEIVSVKKDMTLLQKSEFSSLKTDTQKISIELSQIQGRMNDEIVKLKGQFRLDINLERGRAIEAHAENEKRVQQVHNKIDTEIANLKTIYEVYRNDVFKYAGGTVIAVGGLILGVIRIWS